MTAPARIHQDDIERAARAVRKAGWQSARMHLDLARGCIDVFLSDLADAACESPGARGNEWDEELGE